ncbi:MAG: type 4a pilus biogenesis protein PilO [Pseudomonadota bacterium]
MSFLDDLKNVDINNIGGWPLPLKIAGIGIICLLLLGGGWYFIIEGELDQYDVAKKKEEGLRELFLGKKEQAINLPAYRQQMEEIHQTFGSLLRQLPNSTEVPELLVDITQAGLGRGLEFVLFKPEREIAKQFYAELPISIQVTGNYHELALFISDVSALPRIVTFGNITITPASGNRLNMSAQAYTYRYIDDQGSPAPVAKPSRKQGAL